MDGPEVMIGVGITPAKPDRLPDLPAAQLRPFKSSCPPLLNCDRSNLNRSSTAETLRFLRRK